MPFTAMSVGWEAAFRIKRPPDTPNRLNRLRGAPCLEVDRNWPDADLAQRQLLGRLFGAKRTRYAKRRETGKE